MTQTFGSINYKSTASDAEVLKLCDVSALGVVTEFLRKISYNSDGSTTVTNTTLDGVTPYVITGTVKVCDKELLQDTNTLCALVDSPADYPNVGDPVGTAYSAGDKIVFQYAVNSENVFTPILTAVKNLSNGTYPLPFYMENNGVVVIGTTPPNPADFSACPDQCIKVEPRCKCDDVNGDGSVIVNFVQAYQICITNGVVVSTLIGSYTDDTYSTPYVVQGAVVNCSAIGASARVSQQRLVLSGAGSWVVPGDVLAYSIKVVQANGGPTFTDTSGIVTPLFVGESVSFSDGSEEGMVFVPGAIVTTLGGDIVVIDYQRITV
jgi:hypothetical protein